MIDSKRQIGNQLQKEQMLGILLQNDHKDNKISEFFAEKLKVSPDATITNLISKNIRNTGGGIESKIWFLTLNTGEEFFIKQVYNPASVKTQFETDREIAKVLGDEIENCPNFVLAKTGLYLNIKKQLNQGLIFFPKVNGEMLYNYLERSSQEENLKIAEDLGRMLARIHIASMKNQGKYDKFLENHHLESVLIHPDFQASNILINRVDNSIYLVDNEGASSQKNLNPYQNLIDLKYIYGGENNKDFLERALTGYLEEFPEEHRSEIRKVLIQKL